VPSQDSELIQDAELSFKLLEFSIRTMCYAELGKIDTVLFGQDLQINLEEENLLYRQGEFSDFGKIILASKMSIGAAFAATAISLDCVLEKYRSENQNIETIKKLIQAVRNAFSHGIANPVWYVKPHKREILDLNFICAPTIDLGALNGNTFKSSDIGGYAAWYRAKTYVLTELGAGGT
jgi:hypothetical protein